VVFICQKLTLNSVTQNKKMIKFNPNPIKNIILLHFVAQNYFSIKLVVFIIVINGKL